MTTLSPLPTVGDLDSGELVLADTDRDYQAQLLYEAGFIEEDAYSALRRGPFTDEFHMNV